jgi:hypothetical protein
MASPQLLPTNLSLFLRAMASPQLLPTTLSLFLRAMAFPELLPTTFSLFLPPHNSVSLAKLRYLQKQQSTIYI